MLTIKKHSLLPLPLKLLPHLQFNEYECQIYLIKMNERSYSLQKIPTEPSMKRQNSLRFINSRLNFPLPGDSSLFSNAGRKHFENHSDKMLKIILPQKFAYEKPLIVKKQFHPPHLIRHSSEHLGEDSKNHSQFGQKQKIAPQNASLRDKIEDELDRMKKSMEIHKKAKIIPVHVEQAKPVFQIKDETSHSPKINQIFSITPIVSFRKEASPQRNASQLLYNPENKEKYDTVLKGRWMSPTNLSTGLSII